MIRRTRTEIVKYYGDDLKLQGFKFPDVADPQPLFYKFSATEDEIRLRDLLYFGVRPTVRESGFSAEIVQELAKEQLIQLGAMNGSVPSIVVF